MKSHTKVSGMVKAIVIDEDGNIKNYPRGFWRTLFGLPAKQMIVSHHNMLTSNGEKYIADCIAVVHHMEKVNSSAGSITFGDGWDGSCPSGDDFINSFVDYVDIDEGYPKVNETNQNTVVFKTTVSQGKLGNCILNEVSIQAEFNIAYAQISPAITMTTNDSLVLEWSIQINGT